MDNTQKYIDSREDVEKFITQLRRILLSSSFNINKDLDILSKKSNESPLDPYITKNTLAALEYDRYDVRNELLNITISDYIETLPDIKNPFSAPFYVFIRDIQNRDVYIKVKIRDKLSGKIFCISFHFARYPIKKPLPYEI